MPTNISFKRLKDISLKETPNEVIIETQEKVRLHVEQVDDRTIINLPYGNKFDIINGKIIIKPY